MNTIALACINNNNNQRMRASSGGMYALIAEYVLENEGLVFAVKYNSNWDTVHYVISNKKELKESFGSKYIPSKLGRIFENVKETLDNNKMALFVGTPCQCAGLLSFLNRNYEKLICIDLFCHGVPSRSVWHKYLESLDKDNLKCINMRDKETGWSYYNYNWKLVYTDGKEKNIPQREVGFMKGFVNDLYLRPSCYNCKFKGTERHTDFTIGDYWGVWNAQPELDDNKGISILLVHSEKGENLIHKLDSCFRKEYAEISKVIKYNPSLVNSAKLTKGRNSFYKKFYAGEPIDDIIKTLIKPNKQSVLKVIINKLKEFW